MFGQKLKVFEKGLLLVAVPMIFQFVVIGILVRTQRDATQAERWAMHSRDVITQTELSYRLLVQMVSMHRLLVISGDPKLETNLQALFTRIPAENLALRALVADNPDQVRRIDAYRTSSNRLIEWVRSQLHLVRNGRTPEALQKVQDLSGERLLDTLESQLASILEQEQALNRRRVEGVEAARRQGDEVLGGAAAVAIILAGGMLWVFTRGIAARLSAVADNARRLAEREPLAAAVGGSDEIAAVDAAFRQAADRLRAADATERGYRVELERRADELAAVNRDLVFKTRENETFVYSVSHDLRSPLVNLQGFSRELTHSCTALRETASSETVPAEPRGRLLSLIDGEIAESVRFIQTAVTRSGAIIDALLRLSRAGRIEYRMQQVDVHRTVQRIIEAMQSSVRDRGARVTIAGELPPAWGDPTAIEQIFANLIANAVNYLSPDRPGEIEAGSSGVRTNENGKPSVTYYVKDNGMGIPAAYLPKMFVAFQRLHGQDVPGEGIGLALIRRIVDRHGGRIWLESVEGVGSTFFVSLPSEPDSEGKGPEL